MPTEDDSWPDRIFDQAFPSASAGERRRGNSVSRSTPIVAIALIWRFYSTPATHPLSMHLLHPCSSGRSHEGKLGYVHLVSRFQNIMTFMCNKSGNEVDGPSFPCAESPLGGGSLIQRMQNCLFRNRSFSSKELDPGRLLKGGANHLMTLLNELRISAPHSGQKHRAI